MINIIGQLKLKKLRNDHLITDIVIIREINDLIYLFALYESFSPKNYYNAKEKLNF